MAPKKGMILKVTAVALCIAIPSALTRLGFYEKCLAYFKDSEINYSNAEFGFSITLPNAPEVKESKRLDERSNLTFGKTTVKSVGADNSEFNIGCTNYPPGLLDTSKVYEQLHNGRDGVIENSSFELIKSVDTLINNYPAVYLLTKKGEQLRYVLIVIRNNQSITLLGDLKCNPLQKDHFEHYFNSLKVN